MIHTEAHKCAILPSYQVSLWRHFKIGNLISVTFMLTNENLVSTKGINNSLTWSDHEAKVCGLRYIRQKVGGKHNSWQAFAADSTHTREPETHTRTRTHRNQPTCTSHLSFSFPRVLCLLAHVSCWLVASCCMLIHCDVIPVLLLVPMAMSCRGKATKPGKSVR